MIFFPAIDIHDGKCVRLEQVDKKISKIFDDNPVARAGLFKKLGCQWIHVVDLDGAFSGKPVNYKIIEKIINLKDLNIQLGGGIRDINTIDLWIKLGVQRVILGTAAMKTPQLVFEACEKHPNKIVIGLDVRDGCIAVEGWLEQSDIEAISIAKKFENSGLSSIVYTDISKDGLLRGPSIDETVNFAKKIKTPVIVSGGISCAEDLIQIKSKESFGIEGVISGRAIYDGRLDIKESNKILSN